MFHLDTLSPLFVLAHFLGAVAVTVHVLMWKKDVRAAIGWIGMAWLSPLIGSLLYYAMGINRVARRGARINLRRRRGRTVGRPEKAELTDTPEHIARVARAGDRLTDHPLSAGNDMVFLRNGDEAYPAMLEAIAGARHSVALSSYIFRADGIGRRFIEALAAAHERGVQVRVLLDGVGGGYLHSPVVRALDDRNVPASRFLHHWMPWRMPFLNIRNHKKILVADGRIGFTGGLNIADQNLVAQHPPAAVQDLHFRLEGPVVSQLMLTFAEDWYFTTDEVLEGEGWWPPLTPAGPVIARGISAGPDENVGNLEAVLTLALGAARERIRIVTPYFLPDRPLISALNYAAMRGVKVEVVVPGISDHRVVDWAMRGHLHFFGSPDMSLFLGARPFDHTKLVTVDGGWSMVGTMNWDVRSMRLNFEFGLECYDRRTIAAMDRLIDAKIENARLAMPEDLEGRSVPEQLRNAAARLLLPYL